VTVDHHTALEELVFRRMNAGGGRLLDALAVAVSTRWFGVAVAVALAAAIAIACGRRRAALILALGVALAVSDLVGAQVFRPLFGRMRPCFALAGTMRQLVPVSDVGSIPSLHASNFFAMAAVAWAAGRRLWIAGVAVAALVAWSRVYLGVHWPTDVLAGAAWGTACGLAAVALARRALARREAARGEPTP
jgi:undecaprenyl-diphosphatase